MQNTDYKNLTDDELFVIIDSSEENFLHHFENMKQLVKIDSEFKERFLKIKATNDKELAFKKESDEYKRVEVAIQNLKSRGIL